MNRRGFCGRALAMLLGFLGLGAGAATSLGVVPDVKLKLAKSSQKTRLIPVRQAAHRHVIFMSREAFPTKELAERYAWTEMTWKLGEPVVICGNLYTPQTAVLRDVSGGVVGFGSQHEGTDFWRMTFEATGRELVGAVPSEPAC